MQDRFANLLTGLAAILLIAAPPVWAQNRTSSISGTVTDGSGAVVAGARIVAHRPATGVTRATETDATGLFRLPRLEVGE